MLQSEADEVMTVKEVSVYLRLAQSTVYKLVNEGKLPGRKVGGTWRFSRRGLDKWLREGTFSMPKTISPTVSNKGELSNVSD
jgi:excisionase family DNA binding protein